MKIVFCTLVLLSLSLAIPAAADEYDKAKALAFMSMDQPLLIRTTKLPHNWCHCGACEDINSAYDKALTFIDKKDGECMPDDCDCKYSWKKLPGDPARQYLYDGATKVGGYDLKGRYYRPYDAATNVWGPKGPCPTAPPVTKISSDTRPKTTPVVRPQASSGGCADGSCGVNTGIFRRR
jgi:hypothetical protein